MKYCRAIGAGLVFWKKNTTLRGERNASASCVLLLRRTIDRVKPHTVPGPPFALYSTSCILDKGAPPKASRVRSSPSQNNLKKIAWDDFLKILLLRPLSSPQSVLFIGFGVPGIRFEVLSGSSYIRATTARGYEPPAGGSRGAGLRNRRGRGCSVGNSFLFRSFFAWSGGA